MKLSPETIEEIAQHLDCEIEGLPTADDEEEWIAPSSEDASPVTDQFPRLTTERLVLKALEEKDIPKIVAYAGNEAIAEMTLNIPHPYEAADAHFWIKKAQEGFQQKTEYTFGVYHKETLEFMGGMGIILEPKHNRGSLGYWLAQEHWNQGYTTEAAAAIIRFGFEQLGLQKIYATHLVENPASGKVMIKNGMIKEGELKDHYKKGEVYRSVVQYRLTREEF